MVLRINESRLLQQVVGARLPQQEEGSKEFVFRREILPGNAKKMRAYFSRLSSYFGEGRLSGIGDNISLRNANSTKDKGNISSWQQSSSLSSGETWRDINSTKPKHLSDTCQVSLDFPTYPWLNLGSDAKNSQNLVSHYARFCRDSPSPLLLVL